MKLIKRVGGSVVMFYLVCVLLFIGASGISNVSLMPQAHADTSSDVLKLANAGVSVVAQKVQIKAEHVAEPSVIEEVADKIPGWLTLLTTLVAFAGAIATVTPTPKDNAVLGVVKKVLDIVALNVGRAKNASSSKDPNRLT